MNTPTQDFPMPDYAIALLRRLTGPSDGFIGIGIKNHGTRSKTRASQALYGNPLTGMMTVQNRPHPISPF